MAFSNTEICNLALGRIGARTIMDIDEDEKNARACKNAFELVVKEASRSYPWNCLKRRITCGRLVSAPAFGWSYAYQLPADCLAVLQLNGWDGIPEDEFEIEGSTILTNAEEAKVQYIAYVSDSTKWDPLLASAIVTLLASRVAITLRQDEPLSQMLAQEYERIIAPKGATKSFGERRRQRFDPAAESTFINSRYWGTM